MQYQLLRPFIKVCNMYIYPCLVTKITKILRTSNLNLKGFIYWGLLVYTHRFDILFSWLSTKRWYHTNTSSVGHAAKNDNYSICLSDRLVSWTYVCTWKIIFIFYKPLLHNVRKYLMILTHFKTHDLINYHFDLRIIIDFEPYKCAKYIKLTTSHY